MWGHIGGNIIVKCFFAVRTSIGYKNLKIIQFLEAWTVLTIFNDNFEVVIYTTRNCRIMGKFIETWG